MGSSVSLSGDIAFVGAPGCCFNRGATYVFKNENGVGREKAKLKPKDQYDGNESGDAIVNSSDMVLIGSPGWLDATGKAYTFQETANRWEQQADLKPGFFDSDAFNRFGHSVALSGDFALIGAPHWGKKEPGVAFLFKRTDTGWEEQLKLTASDEIDGNTFGWSVGLNGQYAFVGAPGYSSPTNKIGAVYIYDFYGFSRLVFRQPR